MLRSSEEEEAAERTLEGADAEHWREALHNVQALGFEETEAESILRKAFGWSGQGYWRKSKECEVPQPGQVKPCIGQHACQIFWSLVLTNGPLP